MSDLPAKTSVLIDQLVAGLKPAPRRALLRWAGAGTVAGTVVSAIAVLSLWGVRPDMPGALYASPFWIKVAFTFALTVAGFLAVLKLARPDGTAKRPAFFALAAVLALGALAIVQMVSTPEQLWKSLVMGKTSAVCPWLIMLLAIPILFGMIWAIRRMAPTRLRLAGAAAGLTAGALSALVYSISCDEYAMPFVFVWYGGAIAMLTIVGVLIGPKALRW
jgi:hypothetical protein